MAFQHVLVTGGAGFVGSHICTRLREALPDARVTALDNLTRRGSELNLPRLRHHGVEFLHGDVRCEEDFRAVGAFDLLIDAAAEPSVQAGLQGSPRGLWQINLVGTLNCLEAALERRAAFLFLSTSRIYPIARQNELACTEQATRFALSDAQSTAGASSRGIDETFPLDGARSFYGATKLAAEHLLQEYTFNYQLPTLVNRCGVLAGPWQMGKVDQGFVTLWTARHYYDQPLKYLGYGGSGKQVRDLLHVDDLIDLVLEQMSDVSRWNGRVYNVGGGLDVSTSLLELTEICRDVTGRTVAIEPVAETSPLDIRVYLSDARKVQRDFAWSPQRSVRTIVEEIHDWIVAHEEELRAVLAPGARRPCTLSSSR